MNRHTLINTLVFPVLLSGCVINDHYESLINNNYESLKQQEYYYTGKSIELYLKSRDRAPNRSIALPSNNSIYVWSIDKSYNDKIKCDEDIHGELSCSGRGYVAKSCEISVYTNDENIITKFKYSKECGYKF
jgi:hypothetical protein